MIGGVREDSQQLSAELAKGSAAAVVAEELFIHGQPFHTKNKRWKAKTCRSFEAKSTPQMEIPLMEKRFTPQNQNSLGSA